MSPNRMNLDMNTLLDIVEFCAAEVQRQHAEPLAVWWMVCAWLDAIEDKAENRPVTVDLICRWGRKVEIHMNKQGFRTVPIGISDGCHVRPIGCNPEDITKRLHRLCRFILDPTTSEITPEEAYREFEEIHPFSDGNGRTGKILYNYLKGTLRNPQMPPNFWGIVNP